MRFIDFNGTGGLDSQDIATSVVVDKTAGNSEHEADTGQKPLVGNAGCSTIAALIAIPILILISAL